MYIKFQKKEKQKKKWWIVRHPAALILLAGFSIVPVACSLWRDPSSDERKVFDVCVEGAKEKEDCKKFLRFSVLKKNSSLGRIEDYYPSLSSFGYFKVYFPSNEKMLAPFDEGKYSVSVDVGSESAGERFNRYNSLKEYPVNRAAGDLLIIKESEQGEAGRFFIAPINSDKRILFWCTKPFRAVAGNLVKNTGCTVRAEMRRYVFIEYQIEYQSLHDWNEIHHQVLAHISESLAIKEITKE